MTLIFATPVGHRASTTPPGTVTFDGTFANGVLPWTQTGGAAQCANYGIQSQSPRLRGDLDLVTVAGNKAAQVQLPPSQLPTFPLQACELIHSRPLKLGADDYFGYMFYVPAGWSPQTTTAPRSFWGVTIAEFHFQNIWGSPIEFELHPNHLTLALETGACKTYLTSNPGCTWRSNADNPSGGPGNLGAYYVVPPPMKTNAWYEVMMHVHWASDNTGQIQVWNRPEGQTNWTQTVNLKGHPTVQWNQSSGCCDPTALEAIGGYRGISTKPTSVWVGNFVIGTGFRAVAGALPG